MKVTVQCKSTTRGSQHDTAPRVVVWTGDMTVHPRVGEYVTIFDGWCSEEVIAVDYLLYNHSVVITIGPDYAGEYAKRVADNEEIASHDY